MSSMFPALVRRFGALPLRRRMSWLIAVCAAITTLSCLLAVVGSGLWLQQTSAREETAEVARTLSFSLQAPVAFADQQGTLDALMLLRARPQVEAAFVYGRQGELLASYGPSTALKSAEVEQGLFATRLQATATIESESDIIGRVVVVNRLSRLWQALGLAMLATVLASMAGLALSVRLGQRIAGAITQPIDILADASREIARSHDYTQRLPPAGSDEIGTATQAFNEMLEEIRARGDALVAANLALEGRVLDRTRLLQGEKERAEAASLAKTRFLANMSHELRTPLNAVIGASQLLREGKLDGETHAQLVAAIRDSGTNLLGLIDNILDLARIESGSMELVHQDFNLLDCLDSAVSTASVGARLKGLELACIVEPNLKEWRHGDPTRLRQVLINLLGNAIKFTPGGAVVLRVRQGLRAQDLELSVSDTGIGIGAGSLERVFEPFRQADDGSNRRFGGSGLGLAISRQLAQAMGGDIQVASELGKGSTFTMSVSLQAAVCTPEAPPPLRQTVYYFEPQAASAEALAATLQRLGCAPRRLSNPQELRDGLRGPTPGADPPWLLLALDGGAAGVFEVTSSELVDGKHVLGMGSSPGTTGGAAETRTFLQRSISKPVLRAALVSRLGKVTEVAQPLLPAPCTLALQTAASDASASAKHVLVVEDDLTNQLIVCKMLNNAGFRTSTANNGSDALLALSQHVYDVVLMDWQMPGMDGLETTRLLRAGVAGRFAQVVPIIGLTANAFTEDRNACLAAGMNDYLTKPVLIANLTTAVERWTSRPGGDDDSALASAFAPFV
jgi:signal transduction histidine kinase/ActR/RegA family two-component response regulator